MNKKKILLFVEPISLAHFSRMWVVAKALQALGHEVTYFSGNRYLEFIPEIQGHIHPLGSLDPTVVSKTLKTGSKLFTAEILDQFVREDLDLLNKFKPDLILGDFRLSLSISSRLSGVKFQNLTNYYWSPHLNDNIPAPDIPPVLFWGPRFSCFLMNTFPKVFLNSHISPFKEIAKKYSVDLEFSNLRDLYSNSSRPLYADISELYPSTDSSEIFLGPIEWSPQFSTPDWWDKVDFKRPSIYINLGSSGDPNLLPKIIADLSRSNCNLLIADFFNTSIKTDPSRNIFVSRTLPGKLAARQCQLVIFNGGSPTMYQAISEGTPMIAVPQNLDQFMNCRYLSAAGIGCYVRSSAVHQTDFKQQSLATMNNAETQTQVKTFQKICRNYDLKQRLKACLEVIF